MVRPCGLAAVVGHGAAHGAGRRMATANGVGLGHCDGRIIGRRMGRQKVGQMKQRQVEVKSGIYVTYTDHDLQVARQSQADAEQRGDTERVERLGKYAAMIDGVLSGKEYCYTGD